MSKHRGDRPVQFPQPAPDQPVAMPLPVELPRKVFYPAFGWEVFGPELLGELGISIPPDASNGEPPLLILFVLPTGEQHIWFMTADAARNLATKLTGGIQIVSADQLPRDPR